MNNTKKTGLVFFPAFDWSISPTHPEREERLLYTRDQIFEEGIMDLPQIHEYKPRLASIKDIARAHICIPNVKEQITDAHLIASGGALVIADALMKKEIDNGFVLVRPPGHHAMKVVHGNRGFCSINNEAIMVDYLRKNYGVKKFAIIDTDVHHGDGTQDIFYHDPDVLFVSFHQDGRTLYPGTGFPDEAGGPKAYGRTLNIPLPPGTTDEELHYVLDHFILPVLGEFKPDIVINSAGQDNHYTDPLADMKISAQGYAALNEKLKPDIAVLEGGYAIESALPYVNTGIILAMAGLDYSNVKEPDYNPELFKTNKNRMVYINKVIEELNKVWQRRNTIDIEEMRTKSSFYQTNKNIFYDTDGINEQQTELLRLCMECNGYQIIKTQALWQNGEKNTSLAISIPFNACNNCIQEAYSRFYENKTNNFSYIYLQDKSADKYVVYSNISKETFEY